MRHKGVLAIWNDSGYVIDPEITVQGGRAERMPMYHLRTDASETIDHISESSRGIVPSMPLAVCAIL